MPTQSLGGNFKPDKSIIEGQILGDAYQTKKPNQPYLLDLTTLERVYFQTIPGDILVDSDTNWEAIIAPGRNNARYHYTGGEELIYFTISWYADHPSYQDVILKCKWIEALTKNDGYDNPPPTVQFVFGVLFRDSQWVVKRAPYRLSNFDREQGMLPKVATQDLVLARTSTLNRPRKHIKQITT